MESIDFEFLMPLIILACAPVACMLAISVYRHHLSTFLIAVLSLLIFLISIINLWKLEPAHQVADLLVIDNFSLFYLLLLGVAGLLLLLVSYPYLNRNVSVREEYYILFLTALFGAAVLVASIHFASLFLGLEILSVSLYAMIAYTRNWDSSIEGGLKYLILAAGSSAFLLFGMALLYIETGALGFNGLSETAQNMGAMSTAGIAMMLVGVGFKLALVPFHAWTPDIYQGAPAPVSALIASVSKGSIVAVLIRFVDATNSQQVDWFMWALSLMAIASMLAGSLLALQQTNVKRLLAYSSIAHLGYLLIAIIASSEISLEAVTFYLVAYFISIIGAFGTLSVFSSEHEIEEIEDLQGMFWTHPVLAVVFSVMFFSLVGIPLTAGFLGKFYVLLAAINSGLWLLAAVLVLSSVIGLYYYLRVIKTMLSGHDSIATGTPPPSSSKLRISSSIDLVVLCVLGLAVIWFGVFPSSLLSMIKLLSSGF